MPSDIILHHYAASPFSEKVRLVLGYKNLSWKSVTVPAIMPKPDVQALTGGYRKTPFLQIGSDVYCDSALMCDVLEHIQNAPTLYPESHKGLARVLAQHFIDAGQPFIGFDTDRSHGALLRYYAAYAAPMPLDSHDSLDRVIEAAAEDPSRRVLVDLAAQTQTALTRWLDEAGVATAAIESLAESFCDGVVAPALGLLLFGLPGLFVVKAINTADSMVGHRTPELGAFGWAAARADDVVNFVPARVAGALIALAGRGGWHAMRRDARHHASPNGGWPEAAMAGALGRQLGGEVTYGGEPAHRAVLGDGPPPDAADLMRALGIYRTACLSLWMLVGVVAWLR